MLSAYYAVYTLGMADKPKKKMISLRLDPELIEKVRDYAQTRGPKVTRTEVVEALLEALVEDRLWVVKKPNPFPMEQILPTRPYAGAPGTYPVLKEVTP